MIKKELTYKNVDGEKVTEAFYFNISMNDILEKAVDPKVVAELQAIAEGTDPSATMKTFTGLIAGSVGKRSEGGMGLVKSPEFSAEFLNSDAYSVLMWEILTDAGKAAEFVNGIMPADLAKKIAESGTLELSEKPTKKPEEYTREELLNMPASEFQALMNALPGNNVPKNVLIAAMMRPKS